MYLQQIYNCNLQIEQNICEWILYDCIQLRNLWLVEWQLIEQHIHKTQWENISFGI